MFNRKKDMVKFALPPLCFLLLFGIVTTLYQPLFFVKWVQSLFSDIIFYVPTNGNNYALTFDDGPNPACTDQVLEILEQYGARATFFIIGRRLEKHPEYLKRLREKGHQVGNHSYEDKNTLFLSGREFIESLEKTEELIRQESGDKLFRAAGGWIRPGLLKILHEKGYMFILASAYVSDTKNPSRWYMLNALKCMLKPGVIIVLHDGGPNCNKIIDILPELLKYAQSKRLKSVTIKDLMKSK